MNSEDKQIKETLIIPFYGEKVQIAHSKKSIVRKLFNYTCSRIAFNFPLKSIRIFLHKLRGVNIGEGVFIGRRVTIDNAYPEFIYIDDDAAINQGVTLLAHTNPKRHFDGVIIPNVAPIHIKKGAMLGINSIVLHGVTIGKSSIVSAGSVIVKDVPDYTITQGRKLKRDFNFESLLNNKLV